MKYSHWSALPESPRDFAPHAPRAPLWRDRLSALLFAVGAVGSMLLCLHLERVAS